MTRNRLIVAAVVILLLAIAGNGYLVVRDFTSVNHTANVAKGAASQASSAANDAQQGLADFETLISQRRVENKRALDQLHAQNAATRRLSEKVARLSADRAAENTATLRRDAALIAANRASIAHVAALASEVAQIQTEQQLSGRRSSYETCTQVEGVKKALRQTLAAFLPKGPLPPKVRHAVDQFLARFPPRNCNALR